MPTTVLTDLALALSRRPVTGVDPLRVLGEAAVEIAQALYVAGVVLAVPATGWVRGSDETATLIGEIQRGDGQGPLLTAVRTQRPMLTPDLTRIGPPALAALAAEVGLTGSAAFALGPGGHPVAGIQLIGRLGRPVESWQVEALEPVLAVLGARITDMVEVDRLRRRAVPAPVLPKPVVPPAKAGHARPPARPAAELDARPLGAMPPELVTEEMRAVGGNVLPLQRRPDASRARHAARSDSGAVGQ